ncbi:hypothetical protein A3Q56_03819 [Intoshia linei]|uniref:Mitochondrial import inner membrane translocase subunit Tim23 n=1 Tax=Intoshia linei TaxID=1819745 RepID=A0A177B2H2_9BILA|nr:hypothetical protein A3Q56_03819 [Intoshia linei]
MNIGSLLYSAFGVIIAKARGNDDELNTIAAASLTGIVFKSSSGMKTCLKGGLAGLLLSSVLCVYSSRDRLKQLIH